MAANAQQASMPEFIHRFADEALSCVCSIKCCHFNGCCATAPVRNMEPDPYVEDYDPETIQNTAPVKAHAGLCFMDLPAEIRNKIYTMTVLKDRIIRMRLNPTIMDHGEEHTWGRNNAWAMLGVCRRIYHEASTLAYSENFFEVRRGNHRDFTMIKHPGMPYDRIRFVHLFYPAEASPCNWQMDHMWAHWLDDVDTMRKHFPNLHRLNLKMAYEGYHPNTLFNYYTWAPLLFKAPRETDDAMLKRVTAVLRAMTQLHGRKMPLCVQLNFWGFFHDEDTGALHPAHHEPCMINKAILKVADPNVDFEVYRKESYPMHWPKDPDPYPVSYEDDGNPLEYDRDFEGEESVDGAD